MGDLQHEMKRLRSIVGPDWQCRRYNDRSASCVKESDIATITIAPEGSLSVGFVFQGPGRLERARTLWPAARQAFGLPDTAGPGTYFHGDIAVRYSDNEYTAGFTFSRAEAF